MKNIHFVCDLEPKLSSYPQGDALLLRFFAERERFSSLRYRQAIDLLKRGKLIMRAFKINDGNAIAIIDGLTPTPAAKVIHLFLGIVRVEAAAGI